MNPNNQRLLSVRDLQKQLRTLPIQEQKTLANACKLAEIESPEVIFGSFIGYEPVSELPLTFLLISSYWTTNNTHQIWEQLPENQNHIEYFANAQKGMNTIISAYLFNSNAKMVLS